MKRSACDRCHKQKLRCVKSSTLSRDDSEHSSDSHIQACERCSRAKVNCDNTARASRVSRQRLAAASETIDDTTLDFESRHGSRGAESFDDITNIQGRGSTFQWFTQESWPKPQTLPDSSLEERVLETAHIDMVGAVGIDNDLSNLNPQSSTCFGTSLNGNLGDLSGSQASLGGPDLVNSQPAISQEFEDLSEQLDLEGYLKSLENHGSLPGDVAGWSPVCDDTIDHGFAPMQPSSFLNETHKKAVSHMDRSSFFDAEEACRSRLSRLSQRLEQSRQIDENAHDRCSGLEPGQSVSSQRSADVRSCAIMVKASAERILTDLQEFLSILKILESLAVEVRKYQSLETAWQDDLHGWLRPDSAVTLTNCGAGDSEASLQESTLTEEFTEHGRLIPFDLTEKGKQYKIRLDFTVLLSLISCYTRLLQTSDDFFLEFLATLTIASCRDTTLDLSSSLPEVTLGGFSLQGHDDLKIKSFLFLNLSMLENMESILRVGKTGGDMPHGGLSNDPNMKGLLDALAHQKVFDNVNPDGTRTALVKATIQRIFHLLDKTTVKQIET